MKKTSKKQESKLTPKQEQFCQLFASDREFFGNGVQSYVEAFDVDTTSPGWYAGARASASRLLTNANILARIDALFEAHGLNDQFVDKQLEKLIVQDADFSTKIKAIQEYNKIRSRITQKIEVSAPIPLAELSKAE